MFVVETFDDCGNLPSLRFTGNAGIFGNLKQKEEKFLYKTHSKKGDESTILAYNLLDLVGFFGITKNKNGYGGGSFNINLDGKPVTIQGPWSSREGLFNNKDGSIAIINCPVQSFGDCHFKLTYILDLLQRSKSNIGFFKIARFDDNEIYYIPCANEAGRFSRTLAKFDRSWDVNKVYHYIRPDGTISPVNIPLHVKMENNDKI